MEDAAAGGGGEHVVAKAAEEEGGRCGLGAEGYQVATGGVQE